MKVLILSTGTGEGHNSAGKAMLEQFRKREIPCEMADVLAFASEGGQLWQADLCVEHREGHKSI